MGGPIQWTPHIVPNGGINEAQSPQQIGDNQWSAGTNAEPMPDGVRRRLGSAQSNAIPLQAITVSYEGGTDDREFTSTNKHISQGFQLAATADVSRVAVRLKVNSGSPTGDMDCSIYTNSSGSPNAAEGGLDIAQFNTLDAATITAGYRWYYFTVATPVELTLNTTYHIVIGHLTAPASGANIHIQEVTTPSGYGSTDEIVNTGAKAVSWSKQVNADLNFRVYAGTTTITGIADYSHSDASTQRHLVVADGEVYKNTGAVGAAVMTPVSARERATMTAGATPLVDWAVGNDQWRMTNGTDIAKKFYVDSGTEYWENEGIAAPTATITLTDTAGDAIADGTHYIDWYYWNEDTGVASARRYGGVDTLSVTTGSDHIAITNIPTTIPRENDRVTHIRFEIKVDGSSVYRLVKEMAFDGVTAATTIKDTDFPTTLLAEYVHQVAPVHKAKLIAENRHFILNVTDHPYRLMVNTRVGTVSYLDSFYTSNYRDFGKGDGDYGTALAFMPPRTLIVGMKNSIYAIDARQPLTSDVATISKRVGIAGVRALKVVNRTLYFVSDADYMKGLFMWNGQGEPVPMVKIDDTFKGLDPTKLKHASVGHLSPGDNRFQIWFLLTSNGGTQNDTIIGYDYVLDSVFKYTKPTGREGNVLGEFEDSSVSKLYLGGIDGLEYQQDTGTTDASTAYDGSATLKAFDFSSQWLMKKFRKIEYLVNQQTTGSISLVAEMDYGDKPQSNATLNVTSPSGSFVLDSSTLDSTAILGSASSSLQRRATMRGVGRVMRPTLNSTNQWHLRGISFGFQMLGRK